MRKFYLSSNELITNRRLNDQQYRIYQYLCDHFKMRKMEPWIKFEELSGFFGISFQQVRDYLNFFTTIEINNKRLVEAIWNGRYIKYDMPYYKSFLEDVGFNLVKSDTGFKNLKKEISANLFPKIDKKFLFPNLDQWQLAEHLRDMPDEDFDRIDPNDLKYKWVYRDEKLKRTNTL